MKGKGLMQTYWVLGKGMSAAQFLENEPQQAGAPLKTTSSCSPTSLLRQTSQHGSLAAVVFGMMQASKRNLLPPTTRTYKKTIKYTF